MTACFSLGFRNPTERPQHQSDSESTHVHSAHLRVSAVRTEAWRIRLNPTVRGFADSIESSTLLAYLPDVFLQDQDGNAGSRDQHGDAGQSFQQGGIPGVAIKDGEIDQSACDRC